MAPGLCKKIPFKLWIHFHGSLVVFYESKTADPVANNSIKYRKIVFFRNSVDVISITLIHDRVWINAIMEKFNRA